MDDNKDLETQKEARLKLAYDYYNILKCLIYLKKKKTVIINARIIEYLQKTMKKEYNDAALKSRLKELEEAGLIESRIATKEDDAINERYNETSAGWRKYGTDCSKRKLNVWKITVKGESLLELYEKIYNE